MFACVAALQLGGELADLVDVRTALEQRVGEVGDQLPSVLVVGGEGECTPKQVLGSGEVAALERRASRPAESLGRTPRERCRVRIVRVKLAPVTGRLLEVVPDDLVLLDKSGVRVEPVREALVQLRSRRLREGFVRSVAEQEVAEPECVLRRDQRAVRANELLADERDQPLRHVDARRFGRQRRHRPAVKHLTFHGAAVDHGALAVVERVEPRLQQRLDRRRHLDGTARLPCEGCHLLQEERVPFGGRDDPPPRVGIQVDRVEQRVDELLHLALGERLQQDRGRVQLPTRPARLHVEQLGPCNAEEQDRNAPGPVEDVLDKLEHRRLGPLEIVDDEDQRRVLRASLEQRPRRKLRLGR